MLHNKVWPSTRFCLSRFKSLENFHHQAHKFFVFIYGCRFGFIIAIILRAGYNIECSKINGTLPNETIVNGTLPIGTSYKCHIKPFALCLYQEQHDGYCIQMYIIFVCLATVFASMGKTALPALGGDQVPF